MTVVVFQRASYEEETRPFKVLQKSCEQTFVCHAWGESGRQRCAKSHRFAVSLCKPRRPLRGSVRGRNCLIFLAPFWGRPACAKPKLRFGGGRGDGEGGNSLEGAWSYMERSLTPGEGRKHGEKNGKHGRVRSFLARTIIGAYTAATEDLGSYK